MSGAGRNLRLNGLTIVMMLVLLCMTVFGVLSLTSARAASNLAHKNAEHTASYAECDAEAQKRLAAAAEAVISGSPNTDLAESEAGGARAAFTTERHGSLAIEVEAAISPSGEMEITRYKLITANAQNYGGAPAQLMD